jgi:hypothetical protein
MTLGVSWMSAEVNTNPSVTGLGDEFGKLMQVPAAGFDSDSASMA